MARKPRIEFPGALHHVIVRGNQRQLIFISDDDYLQYLSMLVSYRERFRFGLFAYVLMNDHVHLLILSGKAPLSRIMQGISQSYTMYFNNKYGMCGHLFQGRYRAILCDRDKYLLSLVKYIHLNPVRAGRAAWPDEYPWSSHSVYSTGKDESGTVSTGPVLQMFSENPAAAIKLYREYMDNDAVITKDEVYCVADQTMLGDEHFINSISRKHPSSGAKRRRKEYSLNEIAGAIHKLLGMSLDDLLSSSKSKEVSDAKRLFSLTALEYEYKGIEIAAYLRKDPVIVTRHKKEGGELEKEIHRVIAALKQ